MAKRELVLLDGSDLTGRPTAHARRRQLLALIREFGQLSVTAAAEQLGVSVETLRRDLAVLEERGLVRREYGSAYPVESIGFETDLEHRAGEWLAEKRRIAAEAVEHLEEAESVFIDEGFLPTLIAQHLPDGRPLTVVTASMPVATILAPRPEYTVIMLGGRVRGGTLATVDHWVTRMLKEFVIDLAFIGSNGISPAAGLTTPDPVVAEVKSVAIRASRRRIFVGAHNKFRMSSFCKFAELEDFELLITDVRLSAAEAQRFSVRGPRVIRV
jgi:DeoR family transcriptional regulator, fructose operon transcriptional repressor